MIVSAVSAYLRHRLLKKCNLMIDTADTFQINAQEKSINILREKGYTYELMLQINAI